jgi:hypothetical protein
VYSWGCRICFLGKALIRTQSAPRRGRVLWAVSGILLFTRNIDRLSERAISTLVISLLEEDERTYADCAEGRTLVVVIELGIISWIRHRYAETPALSADLQVGLGGILVFATASGSAARDVAISARCRHFDEVSLAAAFS